MEAILLEGLPDLGYAAADVDVSIPSDLVVDVAGDHVWATVSNLVLNGLRHAGPPIVVTARRDGAMVRIAVSDQGPGVPEELVASLFDRYTRADRPGQAIGTGLGLWIVRTIARSYGGDAWYEQGTTGGSVFICTFPAADDAPVEVSRGD